ncbi:MAG: aldehyde ferredoxin oxidoreductase, partial [Methanoregulaceae archaeon]|nr:aldehyde ferredoxin oxidoreductase [Methanoregulaceae archaeon]
MHRDGYAGEILYVDLSEGTSRRAQYPDSWRNQYIGGRGFGVRIVSDLVRPGTDPLSGENVIAFMTGPLTGSGVPMGSRFDVVTVSPQTGTLSSANSGGHFGPALKRAGLDGIVLTGESESWVTLSISPRQDELVEAGDLRGKTVSKTTRALKEKRGGTH